LRELKVRFPPIPGTRTTVNKAIMSPLEKAVADVRDGSSLYWAFYGPEDRQTGLQRVEVRLNATPETASHFVAPEGWEVERVQWGDTLYLIRQQSLEPHAVETMLVAMLELAASEGMQLHSWIHRPDAG
jgi:hypothetical protein